VGKPQPALRIIRGNAAISVTALQVENANVAVQMSDSMVISGSSDARLLVRSDYGRGLFVLTPDFGRCSTWDRDVYLGGSLDTATHASYKVGTHRDSVTGKDGLELSIGLGAVAVEWSKGLLYVYALTKHIRVTGTEFVVRVDSSFSKAFIYVKNGSVEFEENRGLVGTEQQMLMWTPDGVPQRVFPSPSGLQEDYFFHASEVWKGNPHVIRNTAIGVGAAATVVVILRICCNGGSNRRNGTVVVGLPL